MILKFNMYFAWLICFFSLSCNAEIKESDLFLFGEITKYKGDVVKMLNILEKNHPSCMRHISPATAGISKERSRPNKPSFFVQCGNKDIPEVVRFTLDDVKSGNIPNPIKNIDETKGLDICKNEINKKSLSPLSVNISSFFNIHYDAKPNGNSVISSTVRVKNHFGKNQDFRIFCYFNGQHLSDISVKKN